MREEFEQEIGSYKSILEVFADVRDLDRTGKSSIAYVIEDIREKNPDRWFDDVGMLKNGLLDAKKEGGDPELTWKMAQEVYTRYDSLLEKTMLESGDATTQKNIPSLRKILKEDFEVQRKMYEAKKRVPLGGVSSNHVPKWFSYVG